MADAVEIEPVSAAKFPAIREFAGNLLRFAGNLALRRIENARQIGVTTDIPYTTEQGIFRSGSGNLEHGISSAGKFRGLCWPIAARRTRISMVE